MSLQPNKLGASFEVKSLPPICFYRLNEQLAEQLPSAASPLVTPDIRYAVSSQEAICTREQQQQQTNVETTERERIARDLKVVNKNLTAEAAKIKPIYLIHNKVFKMYIFIHPGHAPPIDAKHLTVGESGAFVNLTVDGENNKMLLPGTTTGEVTKVYQIEVVRTEYFVPLPKQKRPAMIVHLKLKKNALLTRKHTADKLFILRATVADKYEFEFPIKACAAGSEQITWGEQSELMLNLERIHFFPSPATAPCKPCIDYLADREDNTIVNISSLPPSVAVVATKQDTPSPPQQQKPSSTTIVSSSSSSGVMSSKTELDDINVTGEREEESQSLSSNTIDDSSQSNKKRKQQHQEETKPKVNVPLVVIVDGAIGDESNPWRD